MPLDWLNFFLADVRGGLGPYVGVFLLTVVGGAAALSIGAMAIAFAPSFPVVLAAQGMMGVPGDVFPPAVAAITLGLLGAHGLPARLGRNAAFDHAGNVTVALAAGAVGSLFTQTAVFFLLPLCSLFAAWSVLAIPAPGGYGAAFVALACVPFHR